jgi:predicted lipoprotein|tara:strand:+ start:8426 stop:9079 length:654 start_codon:yes stop_codon:yes gene_type:complete
MTSQSNVAPQGASPGLRRFLFPVIIAGMCLGLVLDTKVVQIGSDEDVQDDVFNAAEYGAAEFPRQQALIEEAAVDAVVLSDAIAVDKDAATEQYGRPAGIGPIFSVSFTGIVGEGRSGIFDVAVDGLPEDLRVRVQTGPAINGTELRDATGTIAFGQFTNQIEYQDAGSAINNALKTEVLAELDRENLTGRTITVVGAFRLINPASWLVTPVSLSVQ